MEDVRTIKIKTKPDTRNLYPSERRYSASTVSGLAWVHITLAATSFLLACLAVLKLSSDENIPLKLNATEEILNNNGVLINLSFELEENTTGSVSTNNIDKDNGYILLVATSLLTVFALLAGIASVLASVRWYVDRNITWVLIMSALSTIFAFVSFVMVLIWFISSSDVKDEVSEIYKDKIPFEHYFLAKQSDIIVKNESHLLIGHNNTNVSDENHSNLFTKRVLSVNILITAVLEILWSILSIKIAYKGMKSNYKDDVERKVNCVEVVRTINGNDSKNRPRDLILPSQPNLYPNQKNMKRTFLIQDENDYYLKNKNGNDLKKENIENSSDFYKGWRMSSFLNGCTTEEGSVTDMRTPSLQSDIASNISPEKDIQGSTENIVPTPIKEIERLSWGDTPEHPTYNQNNINLEPFFKFGPQNKVDQQENKLEASEIVNKN